MNHQQSATWRALLSPCPRMPPSVFAALLAILLLALPDRCAAGEIVRKTVKAVSRTATSSPKATAKRPSPVIRPGTGPRHAGIPEDFDSLDKVILKHFEGLEGRRELDLLSKRDVEPLFAKLQAAGWKVSRREKVLADVLPDADEMLQALRTSSGTKFMRQIAAYPQGYDRLDHLRGMPYGMRRVNELIRGPDGYKLIQYMTTTPYGRNLGQQLSQGVNGAGFNKPTGRLYTRAHVLARLKSEHAFDLSEQHRFKRRR